MVDVDDAACVIAAEVIWKNLHETGEYDEFDVLLFDQAADFGEAGIALRAVHVDLMEGDCGVFCDGSAVRG